MQRRSFLGYFKGLFLGLALPWNSTGCSSSSSSSSGGGTSSTNTFSTPPLVEPDSSNTISLTAVEGTTEFYSGYASSTIGMVDNNNNAGTSYLAPTIKVTASNTNSNSTGTAMVDKGTQSAGGYNLNVSITNNTTGEISSHWHGMHCDGYVDGAAYNEIAANGGTWSPTIPIYQQASTCWYHTHVHGKTATDVYKGMAGMFIIEDTNSLALADSGLPNTYGTDDFPLIVQDKKFVDNVMDSTEVGGRFAGDVLLVNGVVTPNLVCEAGLIRFRILNGSNARFYDFSIYDSSDDQVAFSKIATEGGFLAAPVSMTSLRMAPGERNEIVVDFSAFSAGEVLTLKSPDNEEDDGGPGGGGPGVTELDSPFTIMTFELTTQTTATSGNSLPTTLNDQLASDRTALLAKTPDAYARIELKGGDDPIASGYSTSSAPSASNFTFNMTTANFVSKSTQTSPGWTEEWTITGARHPFHLHGCHVMIKSIGGDTNIPEHLQGWKDTIEVDSDSETQSTGTASPIVFMVQFDERAFSAGSNNGPGAGTDYMYMMHCHILGHEDNGMMGVFEVT